MYMLIVFCSPYRVFIEFELRQRGAQAVLDSVIIALKKRQMREPLALYANDHLSRKQRQELVSEDLK